MKLGKNIAIYAGADLLGSSIGLLTSPITTRLLTLEQYGVIPLLTAVWTLVGLAQYGGMDWAYPFFLTQHADDKKRYEILASATIIATISVFIVWGGFSLVALVSPWLKNYAGVNTLELSLFLLRIAPTTLSGWYLYVLRYKHQALPFVRVTLMGRVASVLLVLPFLLLVTQENRLSAMLAGSFVVQLLALGWALWELQHMRSWPYISDFFAPDLVRKMLRYGAVLVPSGIVYSMSTVVDRLLVGWFAGSKEVAILTLAVSIGSIALMLKGWFALAWGPHSIEWVSKNEPEIYLPRLQAVFVGLSSIFFPMVCLAAIWSDWLVTLLYPPYYVSTIRLIPIIILTGTYSVLSLVASLTVRIAYTTKYHLPIYTCAFLINGIIGILTIPKLGALGAILGTLASEFFILASWGVLGKIILKNLELLWNIPLLWGGFSVVFTIFYKPGILLRNLPLVERGLFTAILLSIATYLFWGNQPKEGWKKLLI